MDKYNRISIIREIREKMGIKTNDKVNLYYNERKNYFFISKEILANEFLVKTVSIDERGRFIFPKDARNCFPEKNFLVTYRNNKIIIFII